MSMTDVMPAHAHPLWLDGYERIQNDALGARAKQVEVDTWRIIEDDGTYLGHAIRYEDRRSLALEIWGFDNGHTYDLEKSVLSLGAACYTLRRRRHQIREERRQLLTLISAG